MSCSSCRDSKVSCVIADRGRFFALIVDEKLFRRDNVIIVRISRERFNSLLNRGVRRCHVR